MDACLTLSQHSTRLSRVLFCWLPGHRSAANSACGRCFRAGRRSRVPAKRAALHCDGSSGHPHQVALPTQERTCPQTQVHEGFATCPKTAAQPFAKDARHLTCKWNSQESLNVKIWQRIGSELPAIQGSQSEENVSLVKTNASSGHRQRFLFPRPMCGFVANVALPPNPGHPFRCPAADRCAHRSRRQ